MNTTPSQQPVPARLQVVFTLAHLLERLERTPETVSADQYRLVATRLTDELSRVEMDDGLQVLLKSYPAASEIYENLNYQHAGLCRSPLEASLQAEMRAKDVLARAAKPSSTASR